MKIEITRRNFLGASASMATAASLRNGEGLGAAAAQPPNVVFVFADQWRAQDAGYAGNPQVRTPNLDRMAERSAVFANAVSGCPVCSPYRASLLTGQYWHRHGIFYNDKPLAGEARSMGKLFAEAGYDTAYIGKWHLNGHPPGIDYQESRNAPVPRERRQGFQYWKARECTHEYNQSYYFDEQDRRCQWEGYDSIAQTRMAVEYLKSRRKAEGRPFLMVLSWGPPHDPYHTAPEEFRSLYPDPAKIALRPNVPAASESAAQKVLAGYYAHIAALDRCLGELQQALQETGLEENTVFVFTSDHGDMLYSQGQTMKQKPWDESIRVPFLLRFPARLGNRSRNVQAPINTPDILPTLLGLCRLPIPAAVDGRDYTPLLAGGRETGEEAALLACLVPFHQWNYRNGGREYRGLRTARYTYVRDLRGPWLFYDNRQDPFQLTNLCGRKEFVSLQKEMEKQLAQQLRRAGDRFLPGPEYMRQWGYTWDGQDRPS